MLMMDDDDRVQDQLAGSNSKQQDDQRVASRHQNFHNKQNSKSRTKKICISVAKFVCSTFGLGIIVAGYSALGGFIFMHLEQTNELETCKSSRELYYNALNDTVSRMKILLVSYKNDEDVHNAAASMQTILRQFRDNSVNYDWNTTRVCELLGTAEGQSYQWNLVSAILFSVTITTTVGYGNIAPVTFWGRLVSIAYALMGIPLMLMFLGNIGGIFAKVIRFFYSKICCCGCLISPKKKQPSSSSSQSNLDRTNKSSSPSSNSDDSMEQWKKQFEAAAAARNEQQNTAQASKAAGPVIVEDDADDCEEDEADRPIPLTVALLIIFIYVMVGALIFGVWENWDIVASAYYCFITVSTVGFGDIVPGATTENKDAYKLLGAGIYMLCGMAIISMCFNLIQEEMMAKIVLISTLCGRNKKTSQFNSNNSLQDEQANNVIDEAVRRHMVGRTADGKKVKITPDMVKKNMMTWTTKKPAETPLAPVPEEQPMKNISKPAPRKNVVMVD